MVVAAFAAGISVVASPSFAGISGGERSGAGGQPPAAGPERLGVDDSVECSAGPETLAGAACRRRAEVERIRRLRGPAPRYSDADLVSDRRADRPSDVAPDGQAAGDPGSDEGSDGRSEAAGPGAEAGGAEDPDLPPEVLEELAARSSADRPPPETERSLRERAERLRNRLLDIESELALMGTSGAPTAVRNPNRFTSAFDAGRLLAERDEKTRELEEVAAGIAAARRRPR